VPAVIYGHGEEVQAVQLNYHDLALELQHHHRVLTVELAGNQQQCLVKEIQHDHVRGNILHVDLTRVNLDERVEVHVALEFKGTPAGVEAGGVLNHILGEVELECPVASIPERIRAVVTGLNIGDSLTAGQLELPAGMTLLTDPQAMVAMVTMAAVEVEEEVVAPEGAAEPEVIRREEAEEAQE
jgi:large subunit ribosomal protein L25